MLQQEEFKMCLAVGCDDFDTHGMILMFIGSHRKVLFIIERKNGGITHFTGVHTQFLAAQVYAFCSARPAINSAACEMDSLPVFSTR